MRVTNGSPRWRRAGITAALALGMTLLSGVATANAAAVAKPTEGFVVRTGSLVLTHDGTHYLGNLKVSVRNIGSTAVAYGDFGIDIPAGLTLAGLDGVIACIGVFPHADCSINGTIEPGQVKTVTLTFGSFAAPERFARVTGAGQVTAKPNGTTNPGPWATDNFAGVLRSSTGSVRHPRPYRPSTVSDFALTDGTPVVMREESGDFLVRVPLTAQDRTDAFNVGGVVGYSLPAGAGFPRMDPPAICMGVCDVPPGTWMASGESRDFAMLFTMPAGTAPGNYQATFAGYMNVNTGTAPTDATPDNNAVTVTFTIPAA
jgi:hypothetical protein